MSDATLLATVVTCMARLAAIAVAINTLELFSMQRSFGVRGIWRANTIDGEWGAFRHVLGTHAFPAVLWVQLIAASALLLRQSAWSCALLMLTTLLCAMRFRGNVNGGSDAMLFTVLGGLTLAQLDGATLPVREAGVLYVAAQLTLSYVRAGFVKVRERGWWSGEALAAFVALPAYNVPQTFPRNRLLLQVAGVATIVFELMAPLAWLNPTFCAVFVSAAACFHLAAAYVFGLNRFFWAWGAALPSLWYGVHRAQF